MQSSVVNYKKIKPFEEEVLIDELSEEKTEPSEEKKDEPVEEGDESSEEEETELPKEKKRMSSTKTIHRAPLKKAKSKGNFH